MSFCQRLFPRRFCPYLLCQRVARFVLTDAAQELIVVGDSRSDASQPLKDIVWPPSLEKISFSWCFNEPLEGVVWPEGVREIVFARLPGMCMGGGFNQPVAGVVWPASLQKLTFGVFLQSTHRRRRVANLLAAADIRRNLQPADHGS